MAARRAVALTTSHLGVGVFAYTAGGWHCAPPRTTAAAAPSAADAPLRAALLDHLKERSYVRLAPSAAAGVGVFAVVDIPAGVDPFATPNAHLRPPEACVTLTTDELRACPPAVARHVLDFHELCRHSETVEVNATGLASMDASWYLNHGEAANVAPVVERGRGSAGFASYRTTVPVGAGEELLLDYRAALPSVHARMAGGPGSEGAGL
jgi:hypothetical protein